MKTFFTFVSICILGIGLYAGIQGSNGVLAAGFVGFLALLFYTHIDSISVIKASASGFEAKTKQVERFIGKAEVTLAQLHILAQHVATLTLSLVKRSGRFGGYSDKEEESIRDSVLNVMEKIGIGEDCFEAVLMEWHLFVEFDYVLAILGGNKIPNNVGGEAISDWKNLRDRGYETPSTPEELKVFLKKHNLVSLDRDEYIKDYEYYKANRKHRRSDVWANRKNWGTLDK